jgi:glycosyltransferase involved in cell wall biosynthesis
MKGQCRRAQGGLWYESEAEFGEALSHLLAGPALRRRLATSGKRYVEANYTWERIERKYLDIVKQVTSGGPPSTSAGEA